MAERDAAPPRRAAPPQRRRASTPPPEEPPEEHGHVLFGLAKGWVGVLGLVEASVGAGITSAVKDAATSWMPSAHTIADFARSYPAVTALVGAFVVVLTGVAAWIVWHANPDQPEAQSGGGQQPALLGWALRPQAAYASLGLATASSLAFGGLVGLLVVRPAWCPQAVCAPTLAAYPGPHDQYLGASVVAVQADTYVIPKDPASYTMANLPATDGPRAVAALLTVPADPTHLPPESSYRVAVKLQNLWPDFGDMSIESIALEVDRAAPVGHVNAWRKGATWKLTNNPFGAQYLGQPAGSRVAAAFEGRPLLGHVQLKPGESDTVTIEISSAASIDLTYRVLVTYRSLEQGDLHTFRVPDPVEVWFAGSVDWYEYVLSGGRFTPA